MVKAVEDVAVMEMRIRGGIRRIKDHIENKCTLVCFNVSSLVRLHACSLLVCHEFL